MPSLSSVSVVKNKGRTVQGQPVLQARPWQCERSLQKVKCALRPVHPLSHFSSSCIYHQDVLSQIYSAIALLIKYDCLLPVCDDVIAIINVASKSHLDFVDTSSLSLDACDRQKCLMF